MQKWLDKYQLVDTPACREGRVVTSIWPSTLSLVHSVGVCNYPVKRLGGIRWSMNVTRRVDSTRRSIDKESSVDLWVGEITLNYKPSTGNGCDGSTPSPGISHV